MTLSGVTNARALWPKHIEDNPPPVHCQVLVEFADEYGKAAMLASLGPQMLRARVAELVTNFAGHLSHIDYEVG